MKSEYAAMYADVSSMFPMYLAEAEQDMEGDSAYIRIELKIHWCIFSWWSQWSESVSQITSDKNPRYANTVKTSVCVPKKQ